MGIKYFDRSKETSLFIKKNYTKGITNAVETINNNHNPISVYDKYKNRDFIELKEKNLDTIIKWMFGPKETFNNLSGKSLADVSGFVNKHGFCKFLDSGVIACIREGYDTTFIPFEFKDDSLIISILLPNPFLNGEFQVAFKVLVSKNESDIIKGSYNDKLIVDFIKGELVAYDANIPTALETLFNDHPELKPTNNIKKDLENREKMNEIAQIYFPCISYAGITTVISVNAYLVMQDKEVLFSKIEQKRIYSKADKKHHKKKTNPFYKYLVSIPKDYKPRRFDVNY